MKILFTLLILLCDVISSSPVPHNDLWTEEDVESQAKNEDQSSPALTFESLRKSQTPSRTTFFLPISPELFEKSQTPSKNFQKGTGKVNKDRQSLLPSLPQSKLSKKRDVLSVESPNGKKRSAGQFLYDQRYYGENIDHSRILNYVLGDKRVNSIKRARISGPLVVGSNYNNVASPPHVRLFITENSIPNDHSHSYKEPQGFDFVEPHSLFIQSVNGNKGDSQISPITLDAALNDIDEQTLEINQEQTDLQNSLAGEQVALADNLLKQIQDSVDIDLANQQILEIDLSEIENLPLLHLEEQTTSDNVQEATKESSTLTAQSDSTGAISTAEGYTESEELSKIPKEETDLSQGIAADGQTAALTQTEIFAEQLEEGSNAAIQKLTIPSSDSKFKNGPYILILLN